MEVLLRLPAARVQPANGRGAERQQPEGNQNESGRLGDRGRGGDGNVVDGEIGGRRGQLDVVEVQSGEREFALRERESRQELSGESGGTHLLASLESGEGDRGRRAEVRGGENEVNVTQVAAERDVEGQIVESGRSRVAEHIAGQRLEHGGIYHESPGILRTGERGGDAVVRIGKGGGGSVGVVVEVEHGRGGRSHTERRGRQQNRKASLQFHDSCPQTV